MRETEADLVVLGIELRPMVPGEPKPVLGRLTGARLGGGTRIDGRRVRASLLSENIG